MTTNVEDFRHLVTDDGDWADAIEAAYAEAARKGEPAPHFEPGEYRLGRTIRVGRCGGTDD